MRLAHHRELLPGFAREREVGKDKIMRGQNHGCSGQAAETVRRSRDIGAPASGTATFPYPFATTAAPSSGSNYRSESIFGAATERHPGNRLP